MQTGFIHLTETWLDAVMGVFREARRGRGDLKCPSVFANAELAKQVKARV